jgi:radical SAM superfamily enzyme YgiQ (UPF0313 family)
MKVWLCDLTYAQQSIASDTVPAAIGMIAEYLEQKIPKIPKTKLFKFPEDLSKELEKDQPDVIGFSSYVWSASLSDMFAKRIKEVFPKIITIFGGPNFPSVKEEQFEYLKKKPWIDYFIVKEGEHAFFRLISELINKSSIKVISDLPNLVFIKNGKFYYHKKIERIMNLTEVPSPYLSGRLDSFLDGKLLPIIQTNRGCPFSCTYCTEGQNYWSKIKAKSREVVEGEISYISEKMNNLETDKKRTDFYIADSNFGMYKDDLDTCKALAKEQRKTGYPKYIGVTTGKNKQNRILEAAKIVNGAMRLNGSVQSLDPEVLKNINRSNISKEQIVDLALKSSGIGTNSVSEVILGLPGDTIKKHFATLKTLVNSAFNSIVMYQLMILPGTEIGLKTTKEKYKMQTNFRIIPRCFGIFEVLGKKISVAEIEEICISSNTLSFEDYLKCREMNVIIQIFFNDGIFEEIIFLLRKFNISAWDWLSKIYENSRKTQFKKFNKLLQDFTIDSKKELWKNYEELRKFTYNPDNINKFIKGELGSNLILKYKSKSYTLDLENTSDIAIFSTKQLLSERSINESKLSEFIEDLINYKKCQVQKIFESISSVKRKFKFDIAKFISTKDAITGTINLKKFKYETDVILDFKLNEFQIKQMKFYRNLFGITLEGISRTLSRVHVRKFFRSSHDRNIIKN